MTDESPVESHKIEDVSSVSNSKKKIVGILYVHENNKFQKMCQLINLADSIKKIIKDFFFALTYDRIKRNMYLEAL